MKRSLSACLLVASWLAGCGLVAGGDEGSESHWLSACEDDSDCQSGQCLCGVCSKPCDTAFDCPFPMDQCTSASDSVENGTCTTSPETGICGVSAPERTSLSSGHSRASSCDDGRSSSLHILKDYWSVHSAISLGDEGFALFGGTGYVITVGTSGELRQVLQSPSSNVETVTDLVRLPDGSFVLAGTGSGFAGTTGWVVKVDASWNPIWETEVGSPGVAGVYLAGLPDGEVIAAGTTWEPGVSGDSDFSPSLFWGRIDAAGQLAWLQEQHPDGFTGDTSRTRMMTLTSELEVKLVVASTYGLVMISSDLDGVFESRVLDTDLALYPSDITALPDGRIAIASNKSGAVLSLVNEDGSVAWEKKYSPELSTEADGIAYDPSRGELVLAGAYRGGSDGTQRTWMIATDLAGNQTFELVRQPQEMHGVDGDVSGVDSKTGPGLGDVVVSDTGQIVSVSFYTAQLQYFLVGPEACE